MCLCIPRRQMEHVVTAFRLGLVEMRIGLSKGAKQLSIASFEVQAKGCVEGVTGFMPENPHTLRVSPSLNFQHLFPFELHQPRMSPEQWDGYTGNPIGREPFFSQPHVRFESYAPCV